MGLDMYLEGRRYPARVTSNAAPALVALVEYVGQEPESSTELGYWRKHPNLHGYIVKTFAGGIDKCQPIPLTKEQLQQVLDASQTANLPHTEGFFFGSSDGTEKDDDKAIFEKAIAWLDENDDCARVVVYQASW